jgi:hypothetical protein
MVSLAVIMSNELANGNAQRVLTEQNHALQAGLLYAADEALASSVIFGRPPIGRERHRQERRKPVRCQPITVSGFTMTRTSLPVGPTTAESRPEEAIP